MERIFLQVSIIISIIIPSSTELIAFTAVILVVVSFTTPSSIT